LEEEVELCKSFLYLEKIHYDNSFDYSMEIDNNISLSGTLFPSLLLQPVIENAVKHGVGSLITDNTKAKVTYVEGARTYKGEFPDAPGVKQTRTFNKKFLAEIDALANSPAPEIIKIPKGVQTEAEIERTTLTIKINDELKPGPSPSNNVEFWVILLEESGQRTPESAKVFNDLNWFKNLQTHGHTVSSHDRSTEHGKNYAAYAAKKNITLPCVLLVPKQNSDGEATAIFKLKPTADIEAEIKANGGKW
jgi:hypothetical protein